MSLKVGNIEREKFSLFRETLFTCNELERKTNCKKLHTI